MTAVAANKRTWQRGEYTVLGRRETWLARGWTNGPWGICREESGWWAVTHWPSGFFFGRYPRLRDARAFCDEIAPLTNWKKRRTPDSLTRLPVELRDAVWAARQKHGAVP
jgi:hypothetical protein